jgi:hypothetical protein
MSTTTEQPSLPGTEDQAKVEQPSAAEIARRDILAARQALFDLLEDYVPRQWQTVKLLLTDEGDPMLATTRAYWATYNVVWGAATLLGLNFEDLQEYCADAPRGKRVPHSKIAILASRVLNVIDLPTKIGAGQRSESAKQAFALCRELQKIRKRSDYMGCERLSRERAEQLTVRARNLCDRIWSFTREHYRD